MNMSIRSSQRKLKKITISSFDEKVTNSVLKIVKYFGVNVLHLKLVGKFRGDFFMEVINLLTNLEKISLQCVDIEYSSFFPLKCFKLKEIESFRSPLRTLKCFDNLPSGVLEKLKIENYESTETCQRFKIFENQLNIKEINAKTSIINCLNVKQMKLRKMTVCKTDDSMKPRFYPLEIIKGQNEMTKLDMKDIDWENRKFLSNAHFELICKEMQSLKELRIKVCNNEEEDNQLISMKRLPHLEFLDITLRFWYDDSLNEFLTFFEMENLISLDLTCKSGTFKPETLKTFGNKCPKVQNLRIENENSSMDIFNSIVSSFPLLEDLKLKGFTDKIENPFTCTIKKFHQNLRKFQFREGNIVSKDFAKLIYSMKKLEELEIPKFTKDEIIEKILKTHPKLKNKKLLRENLLSNQICWNIFLSN